MGYQLFLVTLCAAVPALVTPKYGLVLAASTMTSGGSALVHCVHKTPTVLVQTGGRPFGSGSPTPSRSAGSCSSKIALGLSVFPGGAAPPDTVGGNVPRANPSFSHS